MKKMNDTSGWGLNNVTPYIAATAHTFCTTVGAAKNAT
jgi:hypothetical protein